MTTFSTAVCVKHSPEEMYALVNDVESYPGYIPMCTEVRLIRRDEDSLTARISLAKGKIKLGFTTQNTMVPGQRIEMRLVDGPFKRLNGTWTFKPEGEAGCEVRLSMDFEFANALLGLAFGPFFKEVTEAMVEAFSKQAAVKYGSNPKV
jgi:ribosome-associated toxin RatA of RatAB toxin-antitoxin module